MARASRCRFSSQAIMCVQLLSWCVAACLLLYRGVTTLRREPPVPVPSGAGLTNDTLDNDTAPADPVADAAAFNGAAARGRSTPSPANLPLAPPADKSASSDSAYAAKKGDEVSVLYVYSHMNIPSSQGTGSWAGTEAEGAGGAGARAGAGAGASAGAGAGPGHRSSLSRLRYELRPASLILIVLGFSMLLVGPVVVVLRKCDSTLNQRRGAKLPTDEEDACDPPPSYDEATLGCGGAPRYSTLFEVRDSGELVCLNAPPPPPPPEPAPAPQTSVHDSAPAVHSAAHKEVAVDACRKT